MASYIMTMEGMHKVGDLLLRRCLRPISVIPCCGFKKPTKSRVPNRRKVPGLGTYAGQISNFDTNNLGWFPVFIPKIPLNDKDEYKPSKLLVVWKEKTEIGQPYWLQNIMVDVLKFEERFRGPTIVKNTPEVNKMLWHVKHLITIKPLTFPNGIPTMDDLGATYINQNGEMVINKKLQVPLHMIENPDVDEKTLDYETLKKHLRLRWINPWST